VYDGGSAFAGSEIIYFYFYIMIKLKCLVASLLLISSVCTGQKTYKDSMQAFINDYVKEHEVVTGDDKKYLRFFPINEDYRVVARFEKVEKGSWFSMETSGIMKQVYRVHGIIQFTIHDTAFKLNIYQSQRLMAVDEYKDHLFLPFTDLTSGEETYDAGRYIDPTFTDIRGNEVVIDFNKAYNPYCAYVDGKYNCPIPPKENNLNIAILAGEKNYGKR
jgi:uncharacterized protein (DUF1684 family)